MSSLQCPRQVGPLHNSMPCACMHGSTPPGNITCSPSYNRSPQCPGCSTLPPSLPRSRAYLTSTPHSPKDPPHAQTDLTGFSAATGGANRLLKGLPGSAGWLLECVLTFALVFVVLVATDQRRGQSTAHIPILAPMAIGFIVWAAHLAAVAMDGTSINPARSFGPAVTACELPGSLAACLPSLGQGSRCRGQLQVRTCLSSGLGAVGVKWGEGRSGGWPWPPKVLRGCWR